MFFEERIAKIEDKSKSQVKYLFSFHFSLTNLNLKNIFLKLIELETKAKDYESENVKLKDSLNQLSKEKQSLEKRCSTVSFLLLIFLY